MLNGADVKYEVEGTYEGVDEYELDDVEKGLSVYDGRLVERSL